MIHKNKLRVKVINAVIGIMLGHSMMNQNKFHFEVMNVVIVRAVINSQLVQVVSFPTRQFLS